MASDNSVGEYVIEPDKVLGHGSYGFVVQGHHKDTKETVAIKKIKIGGDKKYIEREVSAMRKVSSHRNIVQLLDYQMKGKYHCIVMDHCDRGTLEDFLQEEDVEVSQLVLFITHIVDGVHYMHSLDPPMIHRDLKTENIFIKTINGNLVLKIGDLGLARFISKDGATVTAIGIVC